MRKKAGEDDEDIDGFLNEISSMHIADLLHSIYVIAPVFRGHFAPAVIQVF